MGSISTALGGMEKAQSTLDQVAGRIARGTGSAVDSTSPNGDTVDLSSQMVALLQARNDYKTNAAVVRTADQMQKTLLDLLA